MTYIAVRPSRYSYGLLKETGEFVINLTTEALTFGNLDDPNSEISQLLRQKPTYRYKLALGTKPKLYRVPFKYGEVSQ